MPRSSQPSEKLRKQLVKCGIPEEKQNLTAMKALLAAYFDFSQIHQYDNADEIAEILVYLTQKRLLKLDSDSHPA
jgi:hypothetical protein